MTLDNLDTIRSLDKQDQLGSIRLLGKQVQHGWEDVMKMDIPADFANIDNIVFSGMGGSALGAYVAKHTYGLQLPPFEIINDYNLPSYVQQSTLVIIQSYSGTTEETLHCYEEAAARGSKLITISAGGELQLRAQEHGNPHYTINPTFNPCNQPRMAIGYSIIGLIAILHKLHILNISDDERQDITRVTDDVVATCNEDVPTSQNPAKQMAEQLLNKVPLFCAGEFLQGPMHAIRNQINENAKVYAGEHPIPEMNHHLLEALSYPEVLKGHAAFVFLESSLYSSKITERITHSKQIIEDAGHTTHSITGTGTYKLSHIFSTIQFGAYVGLYLAMLEGINPSPIPNVEKLKKLLAM